MTVSSGFPPRLKSLEEPAPPLPLLLRERRFGSVTRRLRLPDDLAEGDPSAEFADGVLTLRLRKTEKRLPKRIEVR